VRAVCVVLCVRESLGGGVVMVFITTGRDSRANTECVVCVCVYVCVCVCVCERDL